MVSVNVKITFQLNMISFSLLLSKTSKGTVVNDDYLKSPPLHSRSNFNSGAYVFKES